jgi:hypothetical protein
VQAVQSDGVGEEVGDGAMGSGTMTGSGTTTGSQLVASRPKAGSLGDWAGDSDGAALRDVAEAPKEGASMARRRERWRWH